jgi:hypothetical protein
LPNEIGSERLVSEYQLEGRESELSMETVMRACDQPISADALQVVEVTPLPAILPDLFVEDLQRGVKVERAPSPKPVKRKSAKYISKKTFPRPSWADEANSVEGDTDFINSYFPPSRLLVFLPQTPLNTRGRCTTSTTWTGGALRLMFILPP